MILANKAGYITLPTCAHCVIGTSRWPINDFRISGGAVQRPQKHWHFS